jgi:hypothetical protein
LPQPYALLQDTSAHDGRTLVSRTQASSSTWLDSDISQPQKIDGLSNSVPDPSVAKYVRKLVVHWVWKPRERKDFYDAEEARLNESLEGVVAAHHTSWAGASIYSKLHSESFGKTKQEELLVYLIIDTLPNLRSLICTNSYNGNADPELMYTGLVPLLPPMWNNKPTVGASLRKLLVGSQNSCRKNSHPQMYMSYFRLPNLEMLLLFGIMQKDYYFGSLDHNVEQRQE